MLWVDSNDTLNSLTSVLPKDMSNIVQGIQTYGPFEFLLYSEKVIYEFWIMLAEDAGCGMGLGLLSTALLARLAFTPFVIYSQQMGLKMKLLQPDMEEI